VLSEYDKNKEELEFKNSKTMKTIIKDNVYVLIYLAFIASIILIATVIG
jgi:hypothetical protein